MFVRIQRGNLVVLSSVQSLFATSWTIAHQASLFITNSQNLLKYMTIESVMPSNHLILCCPFSSCLQSFSASGSFPRSQFLASDGQSIRSFNLSISPCNEHSGLISFQIDWFDLLAVQGITVDFCCPLMPIAVDKRCLNLWESCGILSEGSPCTITFSFFILFFVSVHQAGLCPFTLSHERL